MAHLFADGPLGSTDAFSVETKGVHCIRDLGVTPEGGHHDCIPPSVCPTSNNRLVIDAMRNSIEAAPRVCIIMTASSHTPSGRVFERRLSFGVASVSPVSGRPSLSMNQNNVHGSASSNSTSRRQFEPLALATLAGVLVMLTISLWNMRAVNRLGERVGKLETQLAGGAAQPTAVRQGPDPTRVYTINVAGAATKGPETAPVTIAEFSDFQCPFCQRVGPTLEQIERVYQDKVRIVWKHLPLSIHQNAMDAALAAEAARNQGKFWEYHDKLFANQDRLDRDDLKRYAKELGLDMTRFEKDILDPDEKKKIDADIAEARTLGVNSTPSFFINGRFIRGVQRFETFSKTIDEELTKLNLPVPPKPSSN
jgi:protein-disulfide isomerase